MLEDLAPADVADYPDLHAVGGTPPDTSGAYAAGIETRTYLFTDIEGSTILLRRLGADGYAQVLSEHHGLIRSSLAAHGGVEQDTQGDSFFATFTGPSAGVTAVLEMQLALTAHTWPGGQPVRVRMGLHTGESTATPTGLVGYEVHRAARVAAVGHGGQVLLSSTAADLVEESLPVDVSVRNLGAHRLKDLGRPEVIFQLVAPGLQSEFPPLTTLDDAETPNNLPASLSPFVGRAEELAEVLQLVAGSRLVTLTGSGGSGKTRLALQAEAALLDGESEGVWFVELAPITAPDQVATAVGNALGLQQLADRPSRDVLVGALRDQHVVVVLDNCEHVIAEVAELAELIGRHCPKVHLVMTSREPLGIEGEQVYRVNALSLPPEEVEGVNDVGGSDAVDLFVARAALHDSTFALVDANAPLVASVCRSLDGIPLAIELATARLASMSLEDLHQRLDHRFRLLTGGSRTASPRQQTLGAMVSWSYDLLTEPERAVLRRLSVFAGSFDLHAAESVATSEAVEVYDVADLLGSLVNKSLVTGERRSSSLRYRLLETIRQFASEQLALDGGDDGVAEVRRAHAEHYLGLGEESAAPLFGPEQGRYLSRLDLEWDNLLAAFTYFGGDPGRSEETLRLGIAVRRLLTSRFHLEPLAYLRDALARGEDVSAPVRARALLETSVVALFGSYFNVASCVEAAGMLEEAGTLSRSLGDRWLEAQVLSWLSLAEQGLDRSESALSHARAALDLARAIDDPWVTGGVLLQYAKLAATPDETRASLLEALACLRQVGDSTWIMSVLSWLARRDLTSLDVVQEARAIVTEAINLGEENDDTWWLTNLYSNLCLCEYLLGEEAEAERIAQRSLATVRRLGMAPSTSCELLLVLACRATTQGDFADAAKLTGAFETQCAVFIGSAWLHSPLVESLQDDNRATLVEALGSDACAELLDLGRRLPFEQVTALALDRG
jgi:predicted ATPase/class 3 adenylate cyclase